MEIKDDKVTLSDIKVMIERNLQQEYSPASIAVGDFTGTGTTNEIAFVTADKEGIYLSVYRLKNNNGTYSDVIFPITVIEDGKDAKNSA